MSTADVVTPVPAYQKCDIPAGRAGEWVVERFKLGKPSPAQAAKLPDWASYRPGTYTQLKRGNTVFMSDLYAEWYLQRDAIIEAWRRGGRILTTGLGLGQLVDCVFGDPGGKVEGITVVEASASVIKLVAPHLKTRWGGRLEIVHADAFDWLPPKGTRYSVGWHDIWPNPYDTSILGEMDQLERRFAPYCDWQASWSREFTTQRNPAGFAEALRGELEIDAELPIRCAQPAARGSTKAPPAHSVN